MGEAKLSKGNSSDTLHVRLEHCRNKGVAALEQLKHAISELRDMKIGPWLEQSLKHEESMKA